MSQFNKKLDQAKSRQKRFYFIAGATAVIILLFIAALFVVSRGTRVEIRPKEAKELAEIKVTEGFGFSIGETVYSLGGNLVITVSATGFKVATKNIAAAHLGKTFPLELFEIPGRLLIQISGINNNLSKTIWQIDGRDVDISDKFDRELDAGHHIVTIDNPFFHLKEVEVEIKRMEQMELQVDLQPVTGVLNISSQPSAAHVFLDEKELGLTPLRLNQNGGLYTLRIAADNYSEATEQLIISRTAPEVTRDYLLEHKKAEVTLDLKPKGGTLLINGVQAAEPLFLDVAVEHRLTYMKTGYYSKTQTILIAADKRNLISFHLKPEKGEVKISSSPPATIWIDNKDYGMTPVSLDLPATAHKITLKKPGYRSISKVVKPKGGRVQEISVTLLTEYQARLQEAPREYTNKAGISLKLYLIEDEFIMGAPRSEKGQRANEFQRKIRLTKPFYASLHEITHSQFAKFKPQKPTGTADTPVTSIGWQEAAAYCNWLSAEEKLQPFYKTGNRRITGFDPFADGYRLLSEGEWEWLARKAGKSRQTIFTWGNETIIPPQTANIADASAQGQVRFYVPNYSDGYSGVAPVGSYNREPSGLYDLAGNVSEWVHDIYSIVPPLPNTTVNNPLGPRSGYGDGHVIKGASFRSGTITTLRPSFREGLTAGRDDVGFRIGRYLYGGENE